MNDLISWFDREFARLEHAWRELIQATDDQRLYQIDNQQNLSVGEQVLKSARIVEQTFGGITANLWDDPFEWTLPETLSTSQKLLAYLGEVESARRRGFALFQSDQDLLKTIMTPAGSTQVMSLLLETLVRAGHYHLNAEERFKQRML
ncbi:MAG TPA: hypothetical protein VF397_00825 [Pyrinomonadaceae bacterium]